MEVAQLYELFRAFAKKVRFCGFTTEEKAKEQAECHHDWQVDYHLDDREGLLCHRCGATRWAGSSSDDET